MLKYLSAAAVVATLMVSPAVFAAETTAADTSMPAVSAEKAPAPAKKMHKKHKMHKKMEEKKDETKAK